MPVWDTLCLARRGGRSMKSFCRCALADSIWAIGKSFGSEGELIAQGLGGGDKNEKQHRKIQNHRSTELIFLLRLAYLLILILGSLLPMVKAKLRQRTCQGTSTIQQPLYREYRGVRLGMTAAECESETWRAGAEE